MKSIFLKAQDSGWYPEFLKPVVETVTAFESNKKILDIGTGPGKLPELLIKHDTFMQIIGIDIDTAIIDEARKRLTHKKVSYQYGKINAPLEFADNEFDVVTFCSVLFLLDDGTKTFLMNEALRVLKPAGKIIVLTPSGEKSVMSAYFEVWRYPFKKNNWTFIFWKTFTSNRGRAWQKQKFLAHYSADHKKEYTTALTFNNNASIEIITKSVIR
ncbi:MAG: class I SAM-dependent methyltransferase [Chitinophagaceae bacterium]|nr:class I SAM-dependent methyltransferase [Chitinophagaceae bacterium]